MDKIIDQITESLALTDTSEDKSLSIFDEHDNKVYGIGKPKVTESEAATIRQCITGSWAKPTRIKVGKCNFLCLRVYKTLLGHGDFNEPAVDEAMGNSRTIQEKHEIESESNEKLEQDRTSNETMLEKEYDVCNDSEKQNLDKVSNLTIQEKDDLEYDTAEKKTEKVTNETKQDKDVFRCDNAERMKLKLDKGSNGKVTLTSVVFKGFLVILMGRDIAGESFMKQTKDIVDKLSITSVDKI